MKKELKRLRERVHQQIGERSQILKTIKTFESEIRGHRMQVRRHEKALVIMRQVGKATQEQLSYNISEITSMALNSVFDHPYDVSLDFVERRGRTECDIGFKRDGELIDPYLGGGGPIDVAAFALRVACWSMKSPRSRNVLVLDEPFKHLKGEEANRRMLDMISQISKKLELQIIMVSDERVSRDYTMEVTDKLFETSIQKGKTKIIEYG